MTKNKEKNPDEKEFKLKISLVRSHGDYMRYRILSFPTKIFENILGEYEIKLEENEFFLILRPTIKLNNNE